MPDKDKVPRDVCLGWDDATQYCANPEHTYFGATIGRVANRIGKGSFTLNGKKYQLPLNDKGFDTLHGGWVGYDRRVWTVLEQSKSSVKFGLESPDGEMVGWTTRIGVGRATALCHPQPPPGLLHACCAAHSPRCAARASEVICAIAARARC